MLYLKPLCVYNGFFVSNNYASFLEAYYLENQTL